MVRIRRDNNAGAFQAAEKVAELSHNSLDSSLMRASLLADANKTDEAIKELTALAANTPAEQGAAARHQLGADDMVAMLGGQHLL